MQNNSFCTNMGIQLCFLSREDEIWRKLTTNVSSIQQPVDISWCLASCCSGQPTMSRRVFENQINEQEKIRVAMTESKNPSLNQKNGPTFMYSRKHKISSPGLQTRLELQAITSPGGSKCSNFFYCASHKKRLLKPIQICSHLASVYVSKLTQNFILPCSPYNIFFLGISRCQRLRAFTLK